MTDIHTTSGPIEIRGIRQPLDYSVPRSLFHAEEEYSPLPGISMILGICASLIGLGLAVGYWIWSA
jgi:hypothetical protein